MGVFHSTAASVFMMSPDAIGSHFLQRHTVNFACDIQGHLVQEDDRFRRLVSDLPSGDVDNALR